VHGVQSIGITTNFDLEEIFELGQISQYENVENVPDIEITVEKVLDGHPLVYHLATEDASSSTLAGRSAAKCQLTLGVWPDTNDSASGNPLVEVDMSGLFVSALSYDLPVEGNFTENVTLVGNHKQWSSANNLLAGVSDNTDAPLEISASGGVNRREDFIWGASDSVLPAGNGGGISGLAGDGTNKTDADGDYITHVQRIGVSADFGREELFQLGQRLPYHRFVNFPVEVTTEIEVLSSSGDLVSATEAGVVGDNSNLSDKTIVLVAREGTRINLGTANKLRSVGYTGGDTGGGNVNTVYTYVNFNDFTVTHNNDPNTALAV